MLWMVESRRPGDATWEKSGKHDYRRALEEAAKGLKQDRQVRLTNEGGKRMSQPFLEAEIRRFGIKV